MRQSSCISRKKGSQMRTSTYIFNDKRLNGATYKAAFVHVDEMGEVSNKYLETAPRDKRRANACKDKRKSVYWR